MSMYVRWLLCYFLITYVGMRLNFVKFNKK